jgi:serine/threonine protein kinase
MMEFIGGYNLDYWISKLGESGSADPRVLQQIQNIVRKLASIGISHNDLYPRNIVVNKEWEILAVVDWDVAGPLYVSQEYIRRKHFNLEPYCHDWDFLFLASCPDKLITVLDWTDHLPVSRRHVIMQCGLVSVERSIS